MKNDQIIPGQYILNVPHRTLEGPTDSFNTYVDLSEFMETETITSLLITMPSKMIIL